MLWLSRIRIINFRSRHQRLQHVGQHLRVGARSQSAFLRTTEFGRRDHFHGLGDLPRVGHAADTAPNVENVGHVLLSAETQLAASLQRYFATACLSVTNVSLHSLIVLVISAFRLSSRTFFSMIVRSTPGFVVSTYL